jgi:two-component system NtrC family sensor kinase
MKIFSFRVKIIGTIILVVSVYSFLSFTVFNIYIKNKLSVQKEHSFSQINLLKDQYYFTINQHDGRILKSMLKNLEKNKDVLRTYLINSRLKVSYPENYTSLGNDTLRFEKLFSQEKDISINNHRNEPVPFHRVFIRMKNASSCYGCHEPSQKYLGMIVMDMANRENSGIIDFSRKFSFYYTLFILLTIFGLVAYLHYKYIRKSMNQFRSAITLINEGYLDSRLAIPEVREFGSLGKDFNKMVETFEKAQKELQAYHQKELQNSQKLATIGEMSARIAHEIRNPITGIARAMEVIIADMKDSDHKPILEEIQRQANRVNQAISNMLRFSRSKDLFLEQGNINEVITSLVFFLKHQAHDKEVNIEMELSEDIPQFSFDHELIENVILNISLNAIQSIPENGIIKLTTRYDSLKQFVIISLSDNGNGIPEEIGKEIFKPFFTSRTKGTGLGLAISKDIIEKHRGELWYENNADKGCTFFISLPV